MTNGKVLLPDKLYNELEQELATDAEKQQRHQARRSEIGKKLGLDVGQPNETAILANGREVQARDALGLLIKWSLYAKKKCSTCYGRGVMRTSVPLPLEVALKMVAENPANEAMLEQREPGKYSSKNEQMCHCARKRYHQEHDRLLNELVKAGLAKVVGRRTDADGFSHATVKLL